MTLRFAVVLGIALAASAATARPQYKFVFLERYKPPRGSALDTAGCATCHVGDTTRLNPYGKDLDKALKASKSSKLTVAVLKKVENLDSDKDGVKNVVEIRAGSLPGDRHVKPALKHVPTKSPRYR